MLEKITKTKLYEGVVEKIKDEIIRGHYKKGSRLPGEHDLALQMGVSRITIREALKHLSEMGIIKTEKGRGSTVLIDAAELLPDQEGEIRQAAQKFRDSFEEVAYAKLIIEPEITRYAAQRATDEDIALLEKYISTFKSNRSVQNETYFQNFHRYIYQMSGSATLTDLYDRFSEMEQLPPLIKLVPPSKQATVSKELNKQHMNLFNAIKARDGEFAYYYSKEHNRYLVQAYKQYFDMLLHVEQKEAE